MTTATTQPGEIAIVGLLSAEPRQTSFTLGSSPDADGPRTPEAFCDLCRPGVRRVPGGVIWIGETPFSADGYWSPAQAGGAGVAQEITVDNILLDRDSIVPGGGKPDDALYQRIQRKGAELFRRLVRHLQQVRPFCDPRFDNSLLELAGHYPPQAADAKARRDQTGLVVDLNRWYRLLNTRPAVASAVVNFLTGCDADEPRRLEHFRRLLKERAREAELDGPRIEGLVGGLQTLRRHLSAGPVGPDADFDPILADLGRGANLGWLFDYAGDPDHFVPGAELEENGAAVPAAGKKPFASYYRQFRRASDAVHRFVRTPAVHGYVICFLASKCRSHGFANQFGAADALFEHCIRPHTDGIPGESAEARARNRLLIDAVFNRPGAVPENLRKDANYLAFRDLVRQDVIDALQPDTALTAVAFMKRLQELFALLYGSSGGEQSAALLRASTVFHRSHGKFFRAILNARPAQEGAQLTPDLFREHVLAECEDEEERAFVTALLNKVPASAPDLRTAVEETFVTAYAERCSGRYDTTYADAAASVHQALALARRVYGLRLLSVVADRGERGPGGTAGLVSPVLPGAGDTGVAEARQANQLEEASAALEDVIPTGLLTPRPATFPDAVGGVALVYEGPDPSFKGKTIGRVEVAGTTLRIVAGDRRAAPLLLSRDVKLCDGEGKPVEVQGKAVSLADFRLRGLDQFAPLSLDSSVEQVVKEAARLPEMQRTLTACSRHAEGSAATAALLRRGQLALIFGEYVLAAPPGQVPWGVADLCHVLGIVTDMICQLGYDPDTNPRLFDNSELPDGSPEKARLRAINLRRAWPFPDSEPQGMRKVLQYYYNTVARLEEVKPYLEDLSVVLRFLDAVRHTDLNVTFVNDTLSHHNAATKTAANLFVARRKPAVAYLSPQAFADNESPAAVLSAFARRLGQAAADTDLDVPLFITPVPGVAQGVGLPVIGPELLQLPRLRAGAAGPNDGDDTVVTRLVQEFPFLPLVGSLFCPDDADFGAVAEATRKMRGPDDRSRVFWDVPDFLRQEVWRDRLNVSIENNQRLAALLHQAWFAYAGPGSVNVLFEHFVFTCLLNLAVREARGKSGRDLREHFGTLVREALRNPEAVAAVLAAYPRPVRAALEYALTHDVLTDLGGAWHPIPEGQRVPVTGKYRVSRAPLPAPPVVLENVRFPAWLKA
jgi:hypothetical protein